MKFLCVLLLVLMPSMGFAQQGWRIDRGRTLYIVHPAGQTPCTVDFEDFIAFAQAFGSRQGEANYNIGADTNRDGVVNFPDFIAFAGVFGLSAESGDCSPRHQILGQIMQQDKPLANVWVDVLEAPAAGLFSNGITQTDSLGHFFSSGLGRGDYTVVPKKFGYQFTPDTVRVTIDDASVTLPPIESVMQFGLVDMKVVQDSLPVAGVEVTLSLSENGQNNQWSGMTDPSGALALRVSVVGERSDITGLYDVQVTHISTGEVLGDWKGISIRFGNQQRLILDVGKGAYYIPEREYFFYLNGEKNVLTSSTEYVTVQFKDGVSDTDRDALLSRLGLEEGRNLSFAPEYRLTLARDYHAMLEVLYVLRDSGMVTFALPRFSQGTRFRIPTDEVQVRFYEHITLSQIGFFASEMGATIDRKEENGSYALKVHDLLSRDIFEVQAQYMNHPFVESIIPAIFAVIVIVN